MKDKVYKVKVDKTNKLLLCVIEFFICLLSLVVGIVLGNIWGLGEYINEILMELLLIAFSVLVFILFPNILRAQEIQAEFKRDYVVIRKKNSKKIIYYKDIAEVQKIMVLNRNHEEKLSELYFEFNRRGVKCC